jgi:tetratricopeptide (TPR) repeat protein
MSVPGLARFLWSSAGLPHLMLVILPLAALSSLMRYRVPQPYLSWVLPGIGVALSALSLLLFFNRLLLHAGAGRLRLTLQRFERWSLSVGLVVLTASVLAPAWLERPWLFPLLLWSGGGLAAAALVVYATRLTATTLSVSLRSSVRWLELSTRLLVVVFVGYGLLVFANGALDFSPPVEQASQVVAVDGADIELGRFGSVSWADLRSWRAVGVERVFLHEQERRRLWPGEAVLVRVHRGALGIPWVSRVSRDDESHYRQVLGVAPTATGPRKRLIAFYLERQRWEDATAVALGYLRLYPDDHEYLSSVAAQLAAARRPKEALALLEPLAARDPDLEPQVRQLRQDAPAPPRP